MSALSKEGAFSKVPFQCLREETRRVKRVSWGGGGRFAFLLVVIFVHYADKADKEVQKPHFIVITRLFTNVATLWEYFTSLREIKSRKMKWTGM